jgi:hypothetical protein
LLFWVLPKYFSNREPRIESEEDDDEEGDDGNDSSEGEFEEYSRDQSQKGVSGKFVAGCSVAHK